MTSAFKRVPVEATPEMQAAGFRILRDDDEPSASKRMQAIYRAMLAASPEPPAEEVETLRAALTDAVAFMKDVRDQRGDSGVGILIRNAEAALSNKGG